MQQLKGRVAVVTGGASGIGLAMARRFASEGMKLVLADIETDALQRARAQLQAMDAQALALTVDVADANGLSLRKRLRPGTELIIPVPQRPPVVSLVHRKDNRLA